MILTPETCDVFAMEGSTKRLRALIDRVRDVDDYPKEATNTGTQP